MRGSALRCSVAPGKSRASAPRSSSQHRFAGQRLRPESDRPSIQRAGTPNFGGSRPRIQRGHDLPGRFRQSQLPGDVAGPERRKIEQGRGVWSESESPRQCISPQERVNRLRDTGGDPSFQRLPAPLFLVPRGDKKSDLGVSAVEMIVARKRGIEARSSRLRKA